MHLSQIQDLVFIEYKRNGYFEMWNRKDIPVQMAKIFDIAELGLVTTEISEAIEIIRNYNNAKLIKRELSKECADIIIRTLNFMSRKDINAEKVILHKNKINMNRGILHNKTV